MNKINYWGLSSKEAAWRLFKYGENSIISRQKFHPLRAFVKKLNSPLLLILIVVSLISFFLGEKTNAIIILVMVFFSTVLDFFNTFKSSKAVEKLLARVHNTSTVWRNHKKKEVPFKNLVVGDVVELTAGDVIPADGKILEAKDFFINQSVLTGESFPVEKHLEDRGEPVPISNFEDSRLVFMGASVVTGFATVEITKIGLNAEFGKIAAHLATSHPETEFEKGIKRFSYFIMRVTFVLVVLVFFFNFLMGRGLFNSFLFAVAIAIGLTPELLPMIVSVALSRGSLKMAQKDVIVKNLSSVENFGGLNILCTDKTGTLTEDKITLVKHINANGQEDENVFLYSYLNSVFHSGIISPLDKAIREHKTLPISDFRKIDEIPFDFERKRDSIVLESNHEKILISKGAPENILEESSSLIINGVEEKIDENNHAKIMLLFDQLSADGFRVLAIAKRKITEEIKVYEKDQEKDLVFLGLAAFFDPAKESAALAIKDLEELGVEVKILTGDREFLTQKICRDISIKVKGTLTGKEIANLSDEELLPLALKTTIFARITPEQKGRIILVLKKGDKTVGFLGDGINDAPALKAADVGISVNNAVDVAKETADIVLLRKSLDVLKDGIIEGRKTFQNTLKYIEMGLSSNFGNMVSLTGASLVLPFLPMLPTQILLNNFLYDVSQVPLPTDSVDAADVKQAPRWDLSFLKKFMLILGPVSSVFDFITFGLLFWVFHLPEHQFQMGWFAESLGTQIFVIYVIRTRKIPFFQSSPGPLLFLSTFLIVALAWLLPTLGLGKYFQLEGLSIKVLFSIVIVIIAYLFVVEIIKRLFYKYIVKNQ